MDVAGDNPSSNLGPGPRPGSGSGSSSGSSSGSGFGPGPRASSGSGSPARTGGGGGGGAAAAASGGGGGGGVELAPGVRIGADKLRFATARSGGPGGQNVNKVETKVEVRVSLDDLPLPGWAIGRLRALAGSRIVGARTERDEQGRERLLGGELVIVAQESRSQSRNKAECMERLRELLVQAMVRPKVRRKTKPSKGSVERRLTEKKVRGDVKRRRGSSPGSD